MKSNCKVFLQLVEVKVSNQNGDNVETYALLDSGECTIITKGLCDSLKLQGKVNKVNFVTIKGEETMKSKMVDLNISSVDGSL